MEQKKAIIIGAGPAGLTAAYEFLKKTDIVPIVLEELNEIGGISKTVEYKGNRMDIGGHRFFSKNEDIMNLWAELMPIQGSPSKDDIMLNIQKKLKQGGPNPEKEDIVMLLRNRVSRILFLRKFFDYPISAKFETFKNLGLIRTIKAGFSYIWSCVFKRKEKSLEDFYINRFGKELYSTFFEDYTHKLWGVPCKEIPPDWGAQRVKGLSIIKVLTDSIRRVFKGDKVNSKKIETSLIQEFYYPKLGPGQLWETLADKVKINGGQVRLNSKVIKINLRNNKIMSVVIDQEGKEEVLEGDYFISSMPIKDLVESLNTNVPTEVLEVATKLPYRDFITVGLLVNKLKIKNKTKIKTVSNIVPDTWIYVQEKDVRIGRLQVFNNWSPYMVKDIENTVWIGLEYFCYENDDMWNMADKDFIDFAVSELVKIDVIDKDDVLDATRIKVKKAYPAYFGAYNRFNEVKMYLDTIDNLYCVGRNGQHRYNNMDHSMLTSIEAVSAIINNTNRDKIWNVNTEEEYHEAKSN